MKRIITIILCFALSFVLVGGSILPGFSFVAKAASEDVSFDDRYIESDLAELGIDMSAYQKNTNDKPSVLQVFEYCYSEDYSTDEYYGLYIYVYNPSETPIDEETSLNCVNMAVEFDKAGEPIKYDNLRIEFLSRTANCRFYKFKLSAPEKLLKIVREYAYQNNDARRYDLIGLQIKFVGAYTAEEFEVNNSYVYTGYAKGLSNESIKAETLQCSHNGLNSINLTLNHTTWRNKNFENYLTQQISSVYFGVPSGYFENYSDLVEISLEWSEARTNPIFVTSSQDRYKELLPYVGKDVGYGGEEPSVRIFWEETEYSSDLLIKEYDFGAYYHAWFYNRTNDNVIKFPQLGDNGYDAFKMYSIKNDATFLSSIFYLLNVESGETLDDYFVNSKSLSEYMRWYTENHIDDEKFMGFSTDLFQSNSYKHLSGKIGNRQIEIDLNAEHTWWLDMLGHEYRPETITFDTINVLKDFYEINDLTSEKFEEKYLVDNKNIGENSSTGNMQEDCIEMYDKGLIPVILHFDISDYYASKARFDNTDYWYTGEGSGEIADVNGYVATEIVYFNFDIISLTFLEENGNKVVIPVVANPINIIAGLTAPTDIIDEPWWKFIVILLTIIIIILAVMFLSGPLSVVFNLILSGVKFILKILLWIIKLPFKLVGALRRR